MRCAGVPDGSVTSETRMTLTPGIDTKEHRSVRRDRESSFAWDGTVAFADSPGGWVPADGVKPAWNWTPPGGIVAKTHVMPTWLRVWYRTPLLDRFAHVWMWHHGFWWCLNAGRSPPPDQAGVREPRRPSPPAGSMVAEASGE